MKKILIPIALLVVLSLLSGCSLLSSTVGGIANTEPTPAHELIDYSVLDYNAGEVLIKSTSLDKLRSTLTKQDSMVVQEWPETGWVLATVPPDKSELDFIKQVKKTAGVVLAEPNLVFETPDSFQDDLILQTEVEDYAKQWGLENINAPAAWEITTGSPDVIVAIVDTGVDSSHPEFSSTEWVAPYDASGENNALVDIDGHGTHVAGIAAANGRSGKIAGVVWDSPIMPIRVMDNSWSVSSSYLVEAMIYLGDYAQNNPDKRIIANMSSGGRGYSFALKDAIDYAAENGVLLVSSAGNDQRRIISYPSAYNGVVSVAASTPHNTKVSDSSEGWWISLAAPGERIWSAFVGGTPENPAYVNRQGTSTAAPFVTGAAALLLAQDPSLTPLEIKNQLEQTARGNTFSEALGHGILDVEALLGPLQPMTYGSLEVTTNLVNFADETLSGSGVITITDSISGALVSYGATGENGRHVFWALRPGTYNITVSFFDRFKEEYAIKTDTATVTAGSKQTANINFDIPTDVVIDVLLSGYALVSASGMSEFPFTIIESGLYQFETMQLGDECDTMLFLYNADGDLIAEDDDSGSSLYSLFRKNLSPGDYTLVIYEWETWAYSDPQELSTSLEISRVNFIY